MKRFIYILFLLSIGLIFTGCQKNFSPILLRENQASLSEVKDLDDLSFDIEKISFSKTYQNIAPEIEIIKQGLDHKVLASLGLINSSGVEIEKITRNGKEIDIFVSNKNKYRTNQLVVPQLVIDIKDIPPGRLENYKFNIHNLNYKPIKIKLDAHEAMNIVNSSSQVYMATYPNINISKNKSNYFWTLEYNNIFDKVYKDSPLINLRATIDADTGEIVETSKVPVSTYIDNGVLLGSIFNDYLIYKKIDLLASKDTIESLWSYNIKAKEKKNLFTSDGKIISASFSPDNKYIVLLESGEKSNSVYIINLSESKAYKINFENTINPEIVRWKDKSNIYIVHKDGSRNLISNYDVEKDDFEMILGTKKNIVDFQVYNGYFLITEIIDSDNNISSIYLSRDLKEIIYKDSGYKGKFINKDQFAYIKGDRESDKDKIYIFDISENKLLDSPEYNISDYTVLSESSLALIEKIENNRMFKLYQYDLDKQESTSLADMPSGKTVLNLFENTLYINTNLPFEEKENRIIYALDISQINTNTEP